MSDAQTPNPDWQAIPEPTLGIWLGFLAMIFGNFMSLLDVQIVASAIGDIQNGVGASRDEISWVQTAYLIAEVIAIPLSGFLSRALGVRLLFSISAVGFSLASVACALSWDLPSLIFFRAAQGFIGGAMIPTTMSALYMIFPAHRQPMAGAMVGLVMTLAPSLGPTVGGYIADALGWRALFWINVIPGFVVAAAVWRYMRLGQFSAAMLKRIDILGLIGLAAMLGAAEYVLEEGPGGNWFEDSEILFWTIVSATGAAVFFWRALTRSIPIVDLRPFGVPTFAIGAVLAFIMGAALFGPVFLQPLFLNEVRGYSATEIGHTMFAQGATMFIMAPIMGVLGRRIPDLRPFGFAGFLLVGWSCWMQAHLTADSAFWEFLTPQAIRGAGMMMAMMSIMQPTIQSLPLHLIQSGTPLFNLVRNLGGAFGLAILSTIQTNSYAFHQQQLYAAANGADPRVQQLVQGASSLAPAYSADPDLLGRAFYAQILNREALVMAFNDGFLWLAVALACASFAIFALKRAAPPAPGQVEPAH